MGKSSELGKKSIFSAAAKRLSFRGRNTEVHHQMQETNTNKAGQQAPVPMAGALLPMNQSDLPLSVPIGGRKSSERLVHSSMLRNNSLITSIQGEAQSEALNNRLSTTSETLNNRLSTASEVINGTHRRSKERSSRNSKHSERSSRNSKHLERSSRNSKHLERPSTRSSKVFMSGTVRDITRADGGLYRGQVNSENIPHGLGRDYSADGFMFYDGMYENGAPSGTGTFNWQDGTEYYGQFKDGEPHGMGEEKRPDGTTYVGEWEAGVENGVGVQRTPSGSEYKGLWVNGRPSVEGTECRKCFWYKGEWSNGIKKGTGKAIWSYPGAPKAIYEGQWRNNLPRGAGEFLLDGGAMLLRGEFRCYDTDVSSGPFLPVIESEQPLIVRFALPDGLGFVGTLIDPISSPPEGCFEDEVAATMAGAMIRQRRSSKVSRRRSLFRRKSKSTTLLDP